MQLTSFSEFHNGAKQDVLFAFGEDRPLAFFAGIWTSGWTGVRKIKSGVETTDIYAFLPHDGSQGQGRCGSPQGHAGDPDPPGGGRDLDDGALGACQDASATDVRQIFADGSVERVPVSTALPGAGSRHLQKSAGCRKPDIHSKTASGLFNAISNRAIRPAERSARQLIQRRRPSANAPKASLTGRLARWSSCMTSQTSSLKAIAAGRTGRSSGCRAARPS